MEAVVLSQNAPATSAHECESRELAIYKMSRQYLGGAKCLKSDPCSRLDVHAAILNGIPFASLIYLLSSLRSVDESDVVNVLGISARTLRRQRETPKKSMPADLASKTWLFAETLAKASEVFGDKQRAEEWLTKSAMGLDGQRPIDLLQTVQGAEIVNDFLTRLEYGVYS